MSQIDSTMQDSVQPIFEMPEQANEQERVLFVSKLPRTRRSTTRDHLRRVTWRLSHTKYNQMVEQDLQNASITELVEKEILPDITQLIDFETSRRLQFGVSHMLDYSEIERLEDDDEGFPVFAVYLHANMWRQPLKSAVAGFVKVTSDEPNASEFTDH